MREADDGPALRVCLDLNVWVANLLALRLGRTGTAAQTCVAAVERGRSPLGHVQLVVSWGMLTRLRAVLEEKLRLPHEVAEPYLAAVAASARVGVPGASLVVLGGTGVMPIRDTEDAHVVDVAIAGRADVIVTANFADFVHYRAVVLQPERVAALSHAEGRVVIAQPAMFAEWVRRGELPAEVLRGGE